MARFNADQRRELFDRLKVRDGARCNICKRYGSRDSLVIDHIDNNPGNNDLSNLQLLYRRHNYLKDPRGKHPVIVLDGRELSLPRPASAEYLKSVRSEPLFCHWLDKLLRSEDRILYDDAINGGAQIAGCSPVTARRYLDKLVSCAGPYQVVYDDLADAKFVQTKGGSTRFGSDLIVDDQGPDAEK